MTCETELIGFYDIRLMTFDTKYVSRWAVQIRNYIAPDRCPVQSFISPYRPSHLM